MEPGSDEWLRFRATVLTGSNAAAILAMRPGFINTIIRARAGDQDADPWAGNGATRWGNLMEPRAIAAFEMAYDIDVKPSRYCEHPDFWDEDEGRFIWAGTPDGFMRDDYGDGLVEVKCPFNPARHYRCWATGKIPDEHIPQMEAYLGITSRRACKFISFDPRVELEKQLFVRTYVSQPALQNKLLERVRECWRLIKAGTPYEVPSNIPELF